MIVELVSRHGLDAAERRMASAGLTPRQREIAALVVEGATNTEVAARLGIAPPTVTVRVTHVFRQDAHVRSGRAREVVVGR